jgi:hypothetical protein
MPIIRTYYLYVSKDVWIRGYVRSQKEFASKKRLGDAVMYISEL